MRQGCIYCDKGIPFSDPSIADFKVFLKKTMGSTNLYMESVVDDKREGLSMAINYCPMCGRKLNGR